MKTRRHISGGLVLAAAALVCLTGCKKDDEGEKITLGVDFEQTAGMQKTYIGNEDKTIYWSTDDNVQVNGTNYLVHDGVVEVNMCDDGYAAVYPATEGNRLTYSGGTSGRYCTGGTVVIPATQNYTTDVNTGVQKLNAPMAARLDTKTGRLLFRNLYAVVKVTVTAGSTPFILSSITVESTNSVNLAGTQAFSFSSATNTAVPTLGSLSNGSNRVVLTDINSTIPANNSASFYLYTAEFSGADLTIRLNRTASETGHARSGIGISRSQLRGTTVNAGNLTPDPEPIDLGLSVIWGPCNVGAENPWEYGDWFAWGETTPKSVYSCLTYVWGTDTNNPSKYNSTDNKTVLDLEDDAAYVNWSGEWRMPTKAEWEELMSKCTWTWTENYESHSGVNGFVIAGHGQQIFLPATGYREGTEDRFVGQHGNYWSASLRSDMTKYAYSMDFFAPGLHVPSSFIDEKDLRYISHTVRPVMPNPNYQPQSN